MYIKLSYCPFVFKEAQNSTSGAAILNSTLQPGRVYVMSFHPRASVFLTKRFRQFQIGRNDITYGGQAAEYYSKWRHTLEAQKNVCRSTQYLLFICDYKKCYKLKNMLSVVTLSFKGGHSRIKHIFSLPLKSKYED